MTWKPIDSAPRDGTWFLAFWPVSAVEDQVRVTRWLDDGDESGWQDSNDWIDWISPTHYMDLPPPPEEKSPSR